jgi:adenine-specific DNA-methyltransferase
LSSLERRIRDKIEAVGTPLKDWNISIYRGVLTGFNEAFIVDRTKKDRLVREDPKSIEILRPILRGRDIKRYSYQFSDLWLISTFPSLKLNIDNYPAVKQHLLSFGYDRLKQTGEPGARKRTKNEWFETQDSISYWDDFSKQKIVWGNLNLRASYALVEAGMFVNAPCPMIVPGNLYLLAVLNSTIGDYYVRGLGVIRNGGYFEYKPMFVEQLPVPSIDEAAQKPFTDLVCKILESKRANRETEKFEEDLDQMIFKLYGLSDEEIHYLQSDRKIIEFTNGSDFVGR